MINAAGREPTGGKQMTMSPITARQRRQPTGNTENPKWWNTPQYKINLSLEKIITDVPNCVEQTYIKKNVWSLTTLCYQKCTRNLNGRTEVTRRLRHTRNKPDYNVNPQKGMRDRGSLKLSQGHKL
jgi:hypothetical protein